MTHLVGMIDILVSLKKLSEDFAWSLSLPRLPCSKQKMKAFWCKACACVCLKFYSQEFRAWRTSILRVCLWYFLPSGPASRNVCRVMCWGRQPGEERRWWPVLVAGDGWGAVADVPGCVDRGLGFPSGPAMTHRPASGNPAPWTADLWLPGPVRLAEWAGPSRDAYTQGAGASGS